MFEQPLVIFAQNRSFISFNINEYKHKSLSQSYHNQDGGWLRSVELVSHTIKLYPV